MTLRALVPLAAIVLLACPPPVPAVPDAGRNTGSPEGPWHEQDMKGEAPLDAGAQMPEAGEGAFSVLVANVGNIDVYRCDTVIYKLCSLDSERAIAARIATARPDIVLLSEVLAPGQCDGLTGLAPWHVCHPDNLTGELDQARRLLGPGYTISCEPRNGYECIAIRIGFGSLRDCPDGELCRGLSRVAPPVAGCDPGFTLSAISAEVDGRALDLIVGHPPSGFTPEAAGCRRAYLPAALEPAGTAGSLRESPLALFGGDLNMDPYRTPADPDALYWNSRVRPALDGPGGPLCLNSGPIEHDPPYWTGPLVRRTWDHVVSEGLAGRCRTLGAARNHPPLDNNTGTELQRLDHLAQWCVLSFR
ncbi:MAG: hypothetical protein ACYC8T_18080 [Myxococcaceae bacterium]